MKHLTKKDKKILKELLSGGEEEVEHKYNLLKTTKEEAGQIVQFLISYHALKEKDFDFRE